MPRYRVTVYESTSQELIVEAANEEDAAREAEWRNGPVIDSDCTEHSVGYVSALDPGYRYEWHQYDRWLDKHGRYAWEEEENDA
jgi:hypothetical protein